MESERASFRRVADGMLIPVLEFDLDLNTAYANPEALKLFGMDTSDIVNKVHLSTLVAKEQLENVYRGLDGLENGAEPKSMSLLVIRKDGARVSCQVYADAIRSKGKLIGFVSYIVDLSRRVAIEDKMRERKDLLEYIIEYSSFAGILIVDDKYRFEYINDKLCDMLGASRSQILGHDFRIYVHPDSIGMVSERYKDRQKGKEVPTTYEFKIRKLDGTPRDVRIYSTTITGSNGGIKTVAQLMDITEQKIDRRLLEESERNFRQLVETMTAGMGVDDANGIITYTNAALNEMLGYEEGELIGTKGLSLLYGISQETQDAIVAARKRGVIGHYSAQIMRKNGELIPVMVSAAPIRSPDGEYKGSFAIFTDVSDLKSAEAEVRFLLDLIMHDVGNQMQLILAGGEFLDKDSSPDQIKRARQYVLDGAERCLNLISKVRKADETKEEPIVDMDLIKVVKEQVAHLQSQYGVEAKVKGLPEKVLIRADSALSQMLWNLIENGIRHNPHSKKEIWISGRKKSKIFILAIGDNGPGLTSSKKDALFNPSRRYGGVGMHLVRRLAEKYNAKLGVSDRITGSPQKGLEVTIEFELVEK